MPDREIIRRNLRNARENRSITQQAAAEHVGLSRTLIAQIELGNRPVSPDELAKLAELYGQSVVDLVGEEAPGNDDLLLMLFDLAPETLSKGARTRVSDILDLCREAASIEEALGRGQKPALPRYEEGRPRTATEALTQGERVALEERRRLGLGRSAVPDLSQLLATQGVRSAVVDLPDDIGGVCFQHDSLGTALWINGRHSDLQQRYALAHEYSHVLLDRDRSVVVAKRGNAGELVEKRANAFAAAFLLPADGVRQVLASFDKDQGSRRTYVAYDELRKEGIRAEGRTAPGSQAITYADVCTLARRFRVSYSAVVHRLRALDVVADVDMKALLGRKSLVAAERLLATFDSHSAGRRSRSDGEAVDLKFEVVSLAVEGYRRGIVDASRLERVASKLRLPQLSSTELLELADAAR